MPRFSSLSRADTATSALKLFVWGAKLGTLGGWVEIAASAADLIANVKALDKAIGDMGLSPLAVALDDIRKDAARALRSGHGNAPHKIADAEALFDQTALSAFPSSARLMELGLDPARVLEEMLTAARQNRDFRDTPMAESFFTMVLDPALKKLFGDKTYLDKLGPDYQRQTLANDTKTHGDLAEIKAMVAALRPAAQAGGLSEETLLTLARRINAQVADPDMARSELERAVEIAANVIAAGLRGSNIDALLNEVLKRLATLTAEGNLTDARAEARKALDDAREGADKAKARHLRLLDAMIEQDTLARDVAAVCERTAEKLVLDHPDPATRFEVLCSIQDGWYERGRDKGLAFDLEVSIALAHRSHDLAADADERGSALNDLAIALGTLGERETGTDRLKEAVAAYRAALEELTRDRVPLDWAMTQMNLGNALRILGQREAGTERLDQAVAAYRAALEEQTRDRVPLKWAMAQMNLANTLLTLGQRETGTERLDQAVTAYHAALEEWTRDRVPLKWAMAQMNLGSALTTLGKRETGTDRLEQAVTAYRAALEEWTRDRVPLDWAGTQMNLGNALRALGQRETGTDRLEQAVTAYRAALEEMTRDRVPLDWAMTQMNLGNALLSLGQRETGTDRLVDAVAACREALEERTRDRVPLQWANTRGNLALAEQELADRTNDPALARDALTKLIEAEQVLRDGGHEAGADIFARSIPEAQALVTKLTP